MHKLLVYNILQHTQHHVLVLNPNFLGVQDCKEFRQINTLKRMRSNKALLRSGLSACPCRRLLRHEQDTIEALGIRDRVGHVEQRIGGDEKVAKIRPVGGRQKRVALQLVSHPNRRGPIE
jgi:hypothetical protein